MLAPLLVVAIVLALLPRLVFLILVFFVLPENLMRTRSSIVPRFVTLATVCANGLPHARTVVFRAWGDAGDDLLFTTDTRSNKMDHIAHQPQVMEANKKAT
mgnify:CR=1 FL=1